MSTIFVIVAFYICMNKLLCLVWWGAWKWATREGEVPRVRWGAWKWAMREDDVSRLILECGGEL